MPTSIRPPRLKVANTNFGGLAPCLDVGDLAGEARRGEVRILSRSDVREGPRDHDGQVGGHRMHANQLLRQLA